MVEVLRSSATGQALAPRLLAADLVAPELLDVEVASALRKNVIRGEATTEDVTLLLVILGEWDIQRVPHLDILVGSIRWWPNATAYDSTYIAVADAWGAVIVTADGPLSRAPNVGVVIENVRVGPPV